MAFDGTERREYLQRLRERAMERMRADELAVAAERGVRPVSRRESLRWIGMAAVATVPAIAALARPQSAFAAAPASGRSGAPQYGAPSWVAPRQPYPIVPVPSNVTKSRGELADVKIWRDTWVQVFSEKVQRGGMGLTQVAAKEGFYADGWGGGTHALLAVADPVAGYDYILRGNQTFYAPMDGDMIACLIGPGTFSMNGSLFQTKYHKDGLAGVIAEFAQVSDNEAYQKDRQGSTISLEKGLPEKFWVRNSDLGWELNYLGTTQASRAGDILTFTVRSNGHPSPATFTIDLKARKLLKTTFEGKDWAA